MDSPGIAEIYEAYFSKIYNFIFYKVIHKEVTEDLVGMIFLKAVEKFHTYDPGKGAVSTWLFAIAQNMLTDYFRTRRVPVSLDEASGEMVLAVDFEEQSSLIADETRRLLYWGLSKLDDRTRDILSRKYFLEKSIRQIAEEKHMNESTVSTIHNRGLEKLRKNMGGVL